MLPDFTLDDDFSLFGSLAAFVGFFVVGFLTAPLLGPATNEEITAFF